MGCWVRESIVFCTLGLLDMPRVSKQGLGFRAGVVEFALGCRIGGAVLRRRVLLVIPSQRIVRYSSS